MQTGGGGGDGGVGDAKKADCVFEGACVSRRKRGSERREGGAGGEQQVKAGATGYVVWVEGGDEQEAEKTALEACRNGRQQTGRRPEAKEQAEYGEARAQSNPRWIQSSAYDHQSRVAPESVHGAVFKFEIVQKGGADGVPSGGQKRRKRGRMRAQSGRRHLELSSHRKRAQESACRASEKVLEAAGRKEDAAASTWPPGWQSNWPP
ncbi:hypothetical protein B0H14DRAFT_2627535 [Mycena olivaceomarginata]|nr:hypothetical protein B0H14DRAFT_2627535 [Mycena olivaceomarginata]